MNNTILKNFAKPLDAGNIMRHINGNIGDFKMRFEDFLITSEYQPDGEDGNFVECAPELATAWFIWDISKTAYGELIDCRNTKEDAENAIRIWIKYENGKL